MQHFHSGSECLFLVSCYMIKVWRQGEPLEKLSLKLWTFPMYERNSDFIGSFEISRNHVARCSQIGSTTYPGFILQERFYVQKKILWSLSFDDICTRCPVARLKLFYPDRFNDTSQIKIFKHFLFTIHNSLIRLSDQVQRQWRIETAIDIGNIYCQTVTVMSRIKILGVVHLHMHRFVSWEYCIGVVLAFLPFLLRYITLFVCFQADI